MNEVRRSMRAISERYAALTEEKRSVFRARMATQRLDPASLPIVPMHDRGDRFPL